MKASNHWLCAWDCTLVQFNRIISRQWHKRVCGLVSLTTFHRETNSKRVLFSFIQVLALITQIFTTWQLSAGAHLNAFWSLPLSDISITIDILHPLSVYGIKKSRCWWHSRITPAGALSWCEWIRQLEFGHYAESGSDCGPTMTLQGYCLDWGTLTF